MTPIFTYLDLGIVALTVAAISFTLGRLFCTRSVEREICAGLEVEA